MGAELVALSHKRRGVTARPVPDWCARPSYTGRVDGHALAVLEFPAIAERLAGVTTTPVGDGLARALTPSPDAAEVRRRQTLTAEAIALLDAADEPDLHGVEDVRDAAAHAA